MSLRYFFYLVLLLVVALIGLISYKKLTAPFKVLTILVSATFVLEGIKKIIGLVFHNSMPIEHITANVEFISFSITYYFFYNSKTVKRVAISLIVAFIILWIICLAFFEGIKEFPSIVLNISQFVYLVYSLFLFKRMLELPSEQSLFKQSVFWFNINMLLYSSCLIFNFGLTNYFLKMHFDLSMLYTFAYTINMVFYSLIGIAILIDRKSAKV